MINHDINHVFNFIVRPTDIEVKFGDIQHKDKNFIFDGLDF